MIKPLVSQVSQTDPATAFSWAASISDPEDGVQQVRQSLNSWRGSDLEAARAAFEAADLPDQERTKLFKELK